MTRKGWVRGCLALLFLAGMAACDGNSDGGSMDQANPAAVESESFALVQAEDAFVNLEAATLSQPAVMNPVLDSAGHLLRPDLHPPGSHLRFILSQLDLTMEQIEEIRAAVMRYREAIREPLEALRAVNQDILDAANAEREEILRAFNAGQITREEAASRLFELNLRTRAAIRSNPENAPYLRAICEARQQLFEEIRAILGLDAQIQWDGWALGFPSCV